MKKFIEKLQAHYRKLIQKPVPTKKEHITIKTYHSYHKIVNKNILVVDDSSVNRYVIMEMIRIIDPSFRVEQAETGIEAIDMCDRKKYGLIFMDILMPYMHGDIAAEKIKEIDPEVYICGITGYIENYNDYLKKGMNSILAKPIELKTLRSFFENVIV